MVRACVLALATTVLASGCAWIRQVSRPIAGSAAGGVADRPSASADGRYVAYAAGSDISAPGVIGGVYRYDAQADTRVLVSRSSGTAVGNQPSSEPAINATGRFIVFTSGADNLVANDTNEVTDVFMRDTTLNTTTRVSVTVAAAQLDDASYSPSISADGRWVAFISDTDIIAEDQNAASDAYVRDLRNGTVWLASVSANTQTDFGVSEAVISGDGKFVAFTTDTDLIAADQNLSDDVYVRNLLLTSTTRISRPADGIPENGGGTSPALSFDGRYVAFVGSADIDGMTDPHPGSDIFVRDTTANTVARVSVTNAGGPLGGSSFDPQLTTDGNRVAFMSTGNPTGTDTNGASADVIVRDRAKNRNILASTDQDIRQLPADSSGPAISGDGRYVLFRSQGSFTSTDTNDLMDVYIRAADVPSVASISPTSVARGATVTVTLNGTGFLPGASVIIAPGIYTPTAVTVVNDLRMTVTLAVDAGAPTGPQTLYVQNVGTGPGTNTGAVGRCSGCLTIT